MIWPLAEAIYFLIGGGLSLAIVPAQANRSALPGVAFDPALAFVFVVGMIMLWPLLVALALAGEPK